jgi:hypothetical protein
MDIRVPNGNDKVYICHNGNTLAVSSYAVPAHLSNHNDQLGSCGQSCNSAAKGNVAETFEEHAHETEIKIYPNPSNGNFSVALPADIENATISLLDMAGKLVESKTGVQGTIQFSQSGIANGVYMIYVTYGTEIFKSLITVY